jgi:hypothetical protein
MSDRTMKRAPGKLNSIWPSQVARTEAWPFEWLDAPKDTMQQVRPGG